MTGLVWVLKFLIAWMVAMVATAAALHWLARVAA